MNIDEFRGKFRSVSIWRIGGFYRNWRAFGYTHHIYFNTHTWSCTVFRNDLVTFCIAMSDYYYITYTHLYARLYDRRKIRCLLSVVFYGLIAFYLGFIYLLDTMFFYTTEFFEIINSFLYRNKIHGIINPPHPCVFIKPIYQSVIHYIAIIYYTLHSCIRFKI